MQGKIWQLFFWQIAGLIMGVPLFTLLFYFGDVQEVMRKRLLYAICEGQGSFDLSWMFLPRTQRTRRI